MKTVEESACIRGYDRHTCVKRGKWHVTAAPAQPVAPATQTQIVIFVM